MRLIPGLVALAAVSACSPRPIAVDGAWVRLPAVAGQPGAAYFTVQGGSRGADTLLSVSTPAALRAEMHESMKDAHGMAAMAPLKDVPVPAGTKLAFAPGGRHVMLFALGPAIKPGGTVPLRFAFASGATIAVTAPVVGAGDPAP
jgi:periplasmic copper chaperone A